ncbi:MAG: hypothetical protein IT320_26060 [Anaerolineae bacterium]|nr:hypothetical protein [Anaerolineae bacterium]
MRKAIVTVLLLLVATTAIYAQDVNQPDYAVYVVDRQISIDSTTIILQFGIYNIGSAADRQTTAELFLEPDDTNPVATQALRPLDTQGDTEILTFELPVEDFPTGSVTFRLEVGIGDIEAADSATIENNRAGVVITVPETTPGVSRTARPPVQPSFTETPALPTATPAPTREPLKILGLEIDTNRLPIPEDNRLLIPAIVALCGVGLILLWVLTVILRLIFPPPRTFEAWQPPYAAMPIQDQNTLAGRRQMWQQSAQSDSLEIPCLEGQYHIRKVLSGLNGENLLGWRVRGLRLSQYDIYGRVARSQTLAPGGLVRKLDRVVRKGSTLTDEEVDKRVRPIARKMVSAVMRKIGKRNMMLPIACDIRFRGAHGEVRILFELYQCANGRPQLIDHWEPEMTVVTGGIQENYTYTLQGIRQGETARTFRQRLQTDLAAVLKTMIYKRPPVPKETMSGDTSPHEPVIIPPVMPEELPSTKPEAPRSEPTEPTEPGAE